jgi:hypothetical protein
MRTILLMLVLSVSAQAAESGAMDLQKALVEHVEAFDLLVIQGEGTPMEFNIELGKTSVKVDGEEYDGFRFRCPEKIEDRDFVWYFNAPSAWGHWYIFPAAGEPEQAFRDWKDADQIYSTFDKADEKDRLRVLQTLDGGYFQAGEEYLMWFHRTGKAQVGTVRGTAAFAKTQKSWDHDAVEKALALGPAPVADQVTALTSHGGLILLDTRFFDADYGKNRIESALLGIRSTQSMRGGFFITMQTFVPSCKSEPSLEEIVKAHGPADFIRDAAELDRVRKHRGGEGLDEDELGVTRYHYDYFSFEVETGAKDPKVLRVGTSGYSFGDLCHEKTGATFGSVEMDNLTAFYQDGKEVGRAYYFLEGGKRPLFITVPPPGEYKAGDQVLIASGDGKWSWESRFADGKVSRRMPLVEDRFHGISEGFRADGSIAFKVTYKNGELDGEAIEYTEGGEVKSRRTFRSGEQTEE